MPLAGLRPRRQDSAGGTGRDAAHHPEGRPGHESHGLPEGRLLVLHPPRARAGNRAPQARRRARRGEVRARVLGRGAHRHLRRHAGRRQGPGPRVDRHLDDPRARRSPLAAVPGCDRLAPHGRQLRVPGLEPRLLHDLGRVRPRLLHGRLVPGGAHPHLALQPGVHQHPVVPLRSGVTVQRRRGGHHRPRLQPLRHPRSTRTTTCPCASARTRPWPWPCAR
jgi:hypothetical protein